MTQLEQPAMPDPAQKPDVQRLYSEHHRWLRAWLLRRVGNPHDAEDLSQDTFVRILRRSDAELQEIHEPRAYLTTIADGLAISLIRRQTLEQAYAEALGNLPATLAPSPEERCIALQTLAEIDRLLGRQPAQVRQIFLLAQLDGLSYAEIAQRTGVSINVVQKAMGRAYMVCYRVLYD